MESRHHPLLVKLADIRFIKLAHRDSQPVNSEINYQIEANKLKFKAEIDTDISDCQYMLKHFIATSYDKNLRLFD